MIVHIAGLDVEVGSLLRQRCAWCGATLIDYDLERVAVPVGQDPRPGTWMVGELVAVDGTASWVVGLAHDAKLPPESCTRIDPAVTA